MNLELPTDANPVVLHQGDCLEVLRALPDGCVDAVVTDPPYGLEFMGKEWDSFRGEAWRSGSGFSKPGIGDRKTPWPSFGAGDSANATCETCGGRMRGAKKCGCDEPQWRVKGKPLEERNGKAEQGRAFQEWCHGWTTAVLRVLKPGGYMLAFGGTRTYHRLACAIEDAGFEVRDCLNWLYGTGFPKGQGCLKPAWEPILLARKPGKRVLPLGVDACRVPGVVPQVTQGVTRRAVDGQAIYGAGRDLRRAPQESNPSPLGRYPANVLHDGSDEVTAAFAAFGERGGGFGTENRAVGAGIYGKFSGATKGRTVGHGDTGTAARFFYCAKASKVERGEGNTHPTVKPLALVRWLVRLVTPGGGTVLDPFAGSGTTGLAALAEGRRTVLVEQDEGYCSIIRHRLAHASGAGSLFAGADP